jgi:hypothetical protein
VGNTRPSLRGRAGGVLNARLPDFSLAAIIAGMHRISWQLLP